MVPRVQHLRKGRSLGAPAAHHVQPRLQHAGEQTHQPVGRRAAAAAAGGGVLFERVHVRNRRLESVTGIQAVFIARLGNQTLED